MAIEPIKGFYVHDEVTGTDGVAKYDAGSLGNMADVMDASFADDNACAPAGVVGKQFDELNKVAGVFGTNRTVLSLANGTPPNSGNAYAVRCTNLIPAVTRDTVKITTDRPVSSGCYYVYGFHEYTATNTPTAYIGYDKNRTSPYYCVYSDSAVGLRISITEYNLSTREVHALRTSDFEGYSVWAEITSYWNFKDEVNGFTLDPAMVTVGTATYLTGAYYNDNTKLRSVGYIPVKKGMLIKFTAGENIDTVFYRFVNSNYEVYSNPGDYFDGAIHEVWQDGFFVAVFYNSQDATAEITTDKYDALLEILTTSQAKGLVVANATRATSIPELRNGSIGNAGNAMAVTTRLVQKINKEYKSLTIRWIGEREQSFEYEWFYCLFRNVDDETTTSSAYTAGVPMYQYNANGDIKTKNPYLTLSIDDIAQYDHISVGLWIANETLRVQTNQFNIELVYSYDDASLNEKEFGDKEVSHKIANAQHMGYSQGTPLTLLHFSDIHADQKALKRISDYAEMFSVDDAICTGDLVAGTNGEIASWWEPSIMTCIGNHDSATYSGGTYNWTALSMADRDAYYIAPFESNWNVTHTSGTSYYYKDYTTNKVRLIVMDCMDYMGGNDASVQTAWLSNLLNDALTNDLHVLIAIHAPHGGSVSVPCSFSRYDTRTRTTSSDCNTPQTIVDTVASAISNGLKFIGYIVGHTHQDDVWDAVGDKSQLMYCVTCANVDTPAQWLFSDQHRSTKEDAFNVVTIDTTNTLIKIVRGGGADIDNVMRTRKAICFNYATGEKVGEVL